MSTQASVTRRRPDCTRNSTSRRLNSCLLIDNTVTAHLPGPQNPGVCHLYLAEGCHLYIALTPPGRVIRFLEIGYVPFRSRAAYGFVAATASIASTIAVAHDSATLRRY